MPERITVAECRELIDMPVTSLADEEILRLRDQAYELAGIVVNAATELDEKALELETNTTSEPDAAIRAVLGWDDSSVYDNYDPPLTAEEREYLEQEQHDYVQERWESWQDD